MAARRVRHVLPVLCHALGKVEKTETLVILIPELVTGLKIDFCNPVEFSKIMKGS